MGRNRNKKPKLRSEHVGQHLLMNLDQILIRLDSPVLDLRDNPIHECRVYDKYGKLIRIHTREELILRERIKARRINLKRLRNDEEWEE